MIRLNESEFKKRFKRNEIVFVSDMGDLFGDFIPTTWILKVLERTRRFPDTWFLFLTKNPKRYHYFLDHFPEKALLGATIETNLDPLYSEYEISRAPKPSERYGAMAKLNWDFKFISIEPILEFELDGFVSWIREIKPRLVFIGYDNYNNRLPEPTLSETLELIEKLKCTTLVIEKTIRKAWYEGDQT